MKRFITILVLLLATSAAFGVYRGQDLLTYCEPRIQGTFQSEDRAGQHKEMFRAGICEGYFQATIEWYELMEVKICHSDDVTVDQSIKVAVEYIKDHPEEIHNLGSYLILKSWIEAYPCEWD